MKKFLKAVGEIDEELLERYDNIEKGLVPKKRSSGFKVALIAACFCLILGSVFAVFQLTGEEVPPIYSDIPDESSSFESSNAEDSSSSISSEAEDSSLPENSDTSKNTSSGETSSGETSSSETSSGETSSGETSSGETSSGETSSGETSSGETSSGETSSGETSSGETSYPEYPPAELEAIYSGEPLWLNPSNGSQSGGGEAAEPLPASTLFYYGMTAVGRVKEIFPDTYARIGAPASELRYRIAVMEITEAMYGNNIPDEIYLMIPSYLDVEALLNYDEMIFAFKQKGFENYVLANETKKRAEAFSVMFRTVPGFAEFCFIPFTDGVFDISLWREKGFNNRFYFHEKYMYEFFTNPEEYQVQIGYTLGQAKKAILDTYAEMRYPPLDRVLYSDIFNSDAAREVLEYCKPFKNGIFAQDAVVQNGSAIFFKRYIYGFDTNEMIRIREKDGSATYYGERFTEEEIEKLPNIANFFNGYDISSLSPEHTNITDKLTVSKPMISGKYIKHGGRIYSVARVAFKIVDDRNWYCSDDTYFLISEDGSGTIIDREELRELTGGDSFVTSFKYNVFQEEVEILA